MKNVLNVNDLELKIPKSTIQYLIRLMPLDNRISIVPTAHFHPLLPYFQYNNET